MQVEAAVARGVIIQAGYWGPGKLRSLRTHTNPGLEIVYVAHGRPVWQAEGRAEVVPAGAVFYTLPWQVHGGVEEVEPGCELYFAVFRMARPYARATSAFGFDRRIGLSRTEEGRIARLLMRSPRHAVAATPALVWLVKRIVAESSARSSDASEALPALARLAVIELARCVDANRPPSDPATDAATRVAAFLKSLDLRCGEEWTIDTMAAACRLGRTRFAHLVKQQTGDPPIMALNRVRVARAKRMLSQTSAAVTQVAMACGFASAQYFARVFREYAGVSARAYRRRGR